MSSNDIVVDEAIAGEAAAALAALGYYPSEPAARTLIAATLMDICETAADVAWLINRVVQLHQEWSSCGIKGLWQIWFSKHRPRNAKERALELQVSSTLAYPDGVPPENPRAELGAGTPMLALPAGAAVSADPENEQLVTDLAEAKALPPMPKYRARTADEKRVDATLRRMYGETVEEKV